MYLLSRFFVIPNPVPRVILRQQYESKNLRSFYRLCGKTGAQILGSPFGGAVTEGDWEGLSALLVILSERSEPKNLRSFYVLCSNWVRRSFGSTSFRSGWQVSWLFCLPHLCGRRFLWFGRLKKQKQCKVNKLVNEFLWELTIAYIYIYIIGSLIKC